jgi:coenzyme F420-dependent glucose-6-phosphate dehydrogenase
MLPGRFFLGVGTGENLNEHILGDRWPSADERLEMLEESVTLMRELWKGELTSFEGDHYFVSDARIYTLPEARIEIAVAASEPNAAELAGRIGDALVSTAPKSELVDAYLGAGGTGSRYGQLTVCFAESEDEARKTALEIWPNAGLEGPLSQELALPSHFEEASAMVDEEKIAEVVVCGPDPERHLDGIRMFADAGFDHVYVHQIGPEQETFIDFYEREILPAARDLEPRAREAARA